MPDQTIRTVTKWGVQLPNGHVCNCDGPEDAVETRDRYRNCIEDEFGVKPEDYHPIVVSRQEITTATEWEPGITEEPR